MPLTFPRSHRDRIALAAALLALWAVLMIPVTLVADDEPRFQAGREALQAGRYDEAIETLEAWQQEARDDAPEDRLREAGEMLDEAHARRASEWVTALERREADLDQAFVFGRRLVNSRRLEDAVRVLAPLVEQAPGDPQAQYWLGQAYLRTQRFDAALEHLEESIALAPDNLALRLELGRAYAIAGETVRAERLFTEIAEAAPDSGTGQEARRQLELVRDEGNLLRRAIAMEDAERFARAQRLYRGLLDAGNSEAAEARFRLGRLQLRLGEYDDAIETLETFRQEARELAPPERLRDAGGLLDEAYARRASEWIEALERQEADHGEAFVFGRRLVNTGRLDAAQRLLPLLVEQVPDDAQAQYWLGQAWLRTGHFDAALEHLEQSVALAPDNLALRLELGQAYEQAGARGRAEQTFQEIDAQAPDSAPAREARRRLNLGRAQRLVEARDWDGALAIYVALLDEHPDDPRLLELKARALEELGRDDELDRVLQRLIAQSPRDIDLLVRAAASLERRGRAREAQPIYVRILALQDDGEAARLALGRLGFGQGVELIREGEYREALVFFERLREVAPESPLVNLNIGMAHHGLREFDEAEAAYQRALAQDERNIGIWLQLGQLFQETERPGEAINALEVALGFARTEQQSQLVRLRLQELYGREVDRRLELADREEVAADDVTDLARTLFQRGFDDEVVRLVAPVLALFPDDPQLHFWFGRASLRLDDEERGVAAIERSVDLAPGNLALIAELGQAYLQVERWDDAEATWEIIATRTPDDELRRRADHNRRLARARGFEAAQDHEAALSQYEALLEQTPGQRSLEIRRGQMLLALGRDTMADEVFDNLLEQAPEDIAFRMRLATLFREHERPAARERVLREVVELAPDHVQARADLGRLYLETGRLDEGLDEYEAAFERLREMDPRQPQVVELVRSLTDQMLRLGRGLTMDGLYDDAERVLGRLVEIQPRNGQAHYWLSQVYHEQGDHEREVERLEEVVELMPGNVLMERRLAFAVANTGDTARAEEILTGVLETFPFDSEIRYRLAELLERQGETERAETELVSLLEMNPTAEWRLRALDRLGMARVEAALERDAPEQALEILRGLLAHVPDDPLPVLALARSYHQAGRIDEAEAMYRRVLELEAGDAGATLGLARLYADNDREAEAIELYHEVATVDPLREEATAAREALDAILQARAQRRLAAVDGITDADTLEDELLPDGREMFELGGHEAAQQVLEHLITQAPDSAPAHYWLGRSYLATERHGDAIVVLRRSIDLAPDEARYHKALGLAYREEQLLRLAGEMLEAARALAPDAMAIAFELAALYEQRGDDEQARETLREILERSPESTDIARALARMGLPERPADLDETRLDVAWERLEPLPPGGLRAPAANHYMAILYERLGRPATDIEAAWEAVLSREPEHPEATLGLARLYMDRQQTGRALPLLQTAADGDGDARVRREAHERLVDILSARAEILAGRITRAEAEPAEALDPGQTLIRRQAFDPAVMLLEAAAAQAPEDPQLFYWLGRALRFSGRSDEALAALARSADLAPGNLQLLQELGIVYQEAERFEEAEAVFVQVAADSEEAGLQRDARRRAGQVRAQRFVRAGDPAAALREIEALLPEHPRDVTLLAERGRLLLLLDNIDEADRTFAHLLEIAPRNVGIRMRLAGIYRTRGESAEYIRQLAAVIAIAPESREADAARAQLGYARGLALLDEQDPAGAQEIFERMLAVVPDDASTRFQLGRAWYMQGRIGEAEMQLTRVVEAEPDNQQAHLLLGSLYVALERWDSAMRAYERAVDLDPQSDEGRQALEQLAELYSDQIQQMVADGRLDEAIRGLRRLVDNAPGNVAARVQLARLYTTVDRYDDALVELREAVRLRPNPLAYRLMAAVHQDRGDPLAMAEALAHAIALEPREEQAGQMARDIVLAVARHMLAENRPYAAIRHLQSLHDARLGSERSWFMLGSIYRQQGLSDDAIRAFREAVRSAPDNVTVRFNLAELYQRNNDLDLALVEYRHIVRRGTPGDRIVEEARRRGEQLRDRLALFTSQLSISLVSGETVIDEQDITDTGALNTSLSSQLFYNLGTNFRPTERSRLRLDTGFSYIGNHSSQITSLIPRVGLSANLDYQNLFYRASAHVSENWDLRSETHLARTYNATLSGGIRFTDTFAMFRGWGRDPTPERGERRIERATLERPESLTGLPADNPGLRDALREIYRLQFVAGTGDEDEWLEREEFIRMSVESTMALYREGRRLQRQGRLDAALAQYRRILDIVPDDALVNLGTGMIHQRRQAFAEAEAAYRRALDHDQAGRPARLRLAEVHADRGRLDEAVVLLTPLADEVVDAAEQAYLRERLQTWRARQLGGLAFDDVYRAELDAAGLASALDAIERGRHRQALETLEGMLAEFPEDPLVWLNLGVAHQRLDQGTRAEAAFQRVVDADERNLNARLRLGMLYGEVGSTDRAITLLERVVSDGSGLEISDRARDALERVERARLRALTDGEEIERGPPASKALQWRLFYSDTDLPQTLLTETYSYGVGLSFNYSSIDYGNWGLNYTFGVRDNKEEFGTDYAYLWHDYGLSWQTPVPNFRGLLGPSENVPGLSAVFSVTRQVRDYLNVDTNALNVLGRVAHRRHVTDSISAGLNYTLPGQDRMSVSLNYNLSRSDTNLPVGIVFTPDGAPLAFQSSGLGAFDSNFISLGLNFRF